MANTTSQAGAIRDLLVERLALYDGSLDISEGSALWTQVVEPVFVALGTDPFDTDIRTFLKDRVTQAFPTLSAQDGDQLVDLLITPLEVLLEPLKREIQIIRRGNSARYPERLRLEDARDLAANFFVEWRSGQRASRIVRVFFAAPTYLNILPTVEFTDRAGLKFYPSTPLVVRPEQMMLFRVGTEYYVDVPVTAEEAGTAYNDSEITSVRGISGFTRLLGLAGSSDGMNAETVEELLTRTQASLTERTLVVRRGIVARLASEFASIVDTEVVGYGDPEMERDVLTGRGEGDVIASGVCFIVGQFVLMFSMFEDRGAHGTRAVKVGDEIELNFWRFLYDTDGGSANEKFTIDTILFDSRNAVTDMPSILLFSIDSVPSVSQPIAGTLPGVLPSVFAVVRSEGTLEISDIPGGILNPDTLRGTIEVNSGEVHIGGHYDVWLRAASSTQDSVSVSGVRSEGALVEGEDLVSGGGAADVTRQHIVHRHYTITSTTSFAVGATLSVAATGAEAVVRAVSVDAGSKVYELVEMNGIEFAVSDTITDGSLSGTVSAVSSQSWEDVGVTRGAVLSIVRGNEEGSYRILRVDGSFLYLDIALTTTAADQLFRVLDEVVLSLFNPRAVLLPFGDAEAMDLQTNIGSALLRTTTNLQHYGVEVGDTIEILEGEDQGTYIIQSWSPTLGGKGAVVDSVLTATNSGLAYSVYRASTALQRPLLRVQPNGVALLDGDSQDTGYRVPYALPVDARNTGSFSGAKTVVEGLNGFVLMDPGSSWAPDTDYATNIGTFDWATWTGGTFEEFYTEEKFRRCYTDECLASEGYIAVISVYGPDGQMYIDSDIPTAAQTFLSNMRAWLLDVISTFNFGGDETELVTAFSPLWFGPNADTAQPLLLQFEILIPFALFDGCNNVFMALPEFDWESEFESQATFGDAIALLNTGVMSGRTPRLLQARPGDVLTLASGPNAGSYIVDEVHTYYLINAGALNGGGDAVILDNAYQVALVVIRGEFPAQALGGLEEFFASGSYTWGLPAVPALPFTTLNGSMVEVSGWEWVELTLTWFFQLMTSMGFDLPESISLDVPETLKALWQLLFTPYAVERPSADQTVRLYFQEPTSCEVYAPLVCARVQWAPPVKSPIALASTSLSLPEAGLDGLDAEIVLEWFGGTTTLTTTLGPAEAAAGTVSALAALLQTALDPDSTYVVFSGPAAATGALTITTVEEGPDVLLYVTAAVASDAFYVLGFDVTPNAQGSATPGTTSTGYVHPEDATLLVGVAGAGELLFTPSADVTPVPVFPGQGTSTDLRELPRDLLVAENYAGQLSAEVSFTDEAYQSPLALGILEDKDWLRVYRQRKILTHTAYTVLDTNLGPDRLAAVVTSFGSNIVELPDFSGTGANIFTFISSNGADEEDVVQVGDVLFIEEGDDAGGYIVVSRSATELVLDRALTSSTERFYAQGNEASLVAGTADLDAGAPNVFSDSDVGRFLTIWGSNRADVDGSFEITAVEPDGSGCTLDTAVFLAEASVHWVLVDAPSETLTGSSVGGRTELLGVRPVRIYSGTPQSFRIVSVSTELQRTPARLFVALDEDGNAPRPGVSQPYDIVRPGVQRISAPAMALQRERGLFYFDVQTHSLHGGALCNLAAQTKLEPVFGTYRSDGYRLSVADNRYTFSTEETAFVTFTPSFLPSTLEDAPENFLALEGRALRFDYEYVPVVAQVQGVLSSETDRVLCANALARHFLPAYVSLDLSYSGGNRPSVVAGSLIDYISSLSAVNDLDLSQLEKILHKNGVTRYDHPITMVTLTHDLDRQIVGTQSANVISDDEVAYNGTNRTTFFIPGADYSTVEQESDIPPGERLRLTRVTTRSSFR